MAEKASSKEEVMSLEEWEFLDFGHDARDLSQKIFFDPQGIINMDYFICPSQHPTPPTTTTIPPHRDDDDDDDDDDDGSRCKEFMKDIPVVVLADQDPVVSQVFFFKKTKDAEFVDMKMGSPMASAKHVEPADPILFDEEEGPYSSHQEVAEQDKEEGGNSSCSEDKKGNHLPEGIGGFTVWRWRVNGIGALCSIGLAAAATICVFILGGSKQTPHQHQHQHQQQKIQFQIYTEDKRIKQAVQQATRLNQAMSAMRGGAPPITRAHISFGGYYDGL